MLREKKDKATGKLEREISEARRFDRGVLTAARSRFGIRISLSTKTGPPEFGELYRRPGEFGELYRRIW